MARKAPMRFFTDQNIPDSVGRFLAAEGYGLTRLREVMATSSPDSIIAVACGYSGHILVTLDGDFKDIAKRLGLTQRQYRNSLHRIILNCPANRTVPRMQDAMSLIQHEWALVRPERPLFMEIRDKVIMTRR